MWKGFRSHSKSTGSPQSGLILQIVYYFLPLSRSLMASSHEMAFKKIERLKFSRFILKSLDFWGKEKGLVQPFRSSFVAPQPFFFVISFGLLGGWGFASPFSVLFPCFAPRIVVVVVSSRQKVRLLSGFVAAWCCFSICFVEINWKKKKISFLRVSVFWLIWPEIFVFVFFFFPSLFSGF